MMSEDNDFWGTDDPTPGQSGLAFIAMLTGIAWLICLPFDLYARLRDRDGTGGDSGCDGADWGSEGPNYIHNGAVD